MNEDNDVIQPQPQPQEEQSQSPDDHLMQFLLQKKMLLGEVKQIAGKCAAKKKISNGEIAKLLDRLIAYLEQSDQILDTLLLEFNQVLNVLPQHSNQLFTIAQSNTALKVALIDKGLVTQQDITDAFNNKIKPELEARLKEQKEEAEKSGLVTPDGVPVENVSNS